MQFKDFSILITAYENVEQVLENVRHIRKNFKEINKCQIVVISTTEKEEVKQKFHSLLYTEGLQPLIVKVLDNSPGNPGVGWEPPNQLYNSWRHKFLPGRVLLSMNHGWNILYEMEIETCLHLHSDTFLKPEYEERLLEEIKEMDLGIWDLCMEDQNSNHVCPEGILLRLPDCKELGILDIFNCFGHGYFRHWNYGSIESLIGCWANYRVSVSNIGIDDKPCQRFQELFDVRCKRPYHGDFEHIRNLSGVQEDASN